MRFYLHRIAIAAASLVFLIAGGPALAESITFKASLTGTEGVPPNDSKGTGSVEATLDTSAKTLAWTITYSGLTGDATAAHFHGPAEKGKNAPPVVPIDGTLTSPIKGTSTLSDRQVTDLQNGLWYFNMHTAAHPDGEIRGQLAK
jgi:hypothetical protein